MNKISDISVTGESAVSGELKRSKPVTRKARYLFVVMAILFPAIVFVGFFPSYQSLNEGTLQIHWLTHIHSALMTSWLLLYLTQTLLAATGNIKIHRQLGPLSFVLGVIVFVFMGIVSFHLVIANHAPKGSFLFNLLLEGFYLMLGFGLFFTWGMLLRKKKPDAHKRLLTLATFALLTAAVDRVLQKYSFPSFGIAYPSFFYQDILLIPLFLYDLITLRRIHKITFTGTAIVILLQVIVSNTFGSPSWYKFGYQLTAPLMEKVNEIKLTNEQSLPLLGDYESAIGKLTISRNNDTLYIQFDGGQKLELGATSETELFLKGEVWTFSFTEGPDGKVATAEAKLIGRTNKMTKVK